MLCATTPAAAGAPAPTVGGFAGTAVPARADPGCRWLRRGGVLGRGGVRGGVSAGPGFLAGWLRVRVRVLGGAVTPGRGWPVAGASAGRWFLARGGRVPVLRRGRGSWCGAVFGGVFRRGRGWKVWCGAPPECLLGSARAAGSRPGGLGCALVLRGHSAVSPPHAPASTTPPAYGPAVPAPRGHGPAPTLPGTGLVLLEWGRGGVSPQDERATTAHGRDGSRAPSRGDTPARRRDRPAPSPYPARRHDPGRPELRPSGRPRLARTVRSRSGREAPGAGLVPAGVGTGRGVPAGRARDHRSWPRRLAGAEPRRYPCAAPRLARTVPVSRPAARPGPAGASALGATPSRPHREVAVRPGGSRSRARACWSGDGEGCPRRTSALPPLMAEMARGRRAEEIPLRGAATRPHRARIRPDGHAPGRPERRPRGGPASPELRGHGPAGGPTRAGRSFGLGATLPRSRAPSRGDTPARHRGRDPVRRRNVPARPVPLCPPYRPAAQPSGGSSR